MKWTETINRHFHVYYKLSIKLYKQTTIKFNRLQRIPMGILCILFWIASFPVLFWSYTYIRVVHPVLHFWSHGIPFKINFIIAWHLLVMILYLSYIYFCSIKRSDSGSEFRKFSDTQRVHEYANFKVCCSCHVSAISSALGERFLMSYPFWCICS